VKEHRAFFEREVKKIYIYFVNKWLLGGKTKPQITYFLFWRTFLSSLYAWLHMYYFDWLCQILPYLSWYFLYYLDKTKSYPHCFKQSWVHFFLVRFKYWHSHCCVSLYSLYTFSHLEFLFLYTSASQSHFMFNNSGSQSGYALTFRYHYFLCYQQLCCFIVTFV